jgi:transposase InsO family protein
VHAVIDNFSRRILAWTVADHLDPMNTRDVLTTAAANLEASTKADVFMDSGVENLNGDVDALFEANVLQRVIAQIDVSFSNSLIEAWWRSLKHQWLFLHPLDNMATVRRLVEFYVTEHNQRMPRSAFQGQTPDEMYCYQQAMNARNGSCVSRRIVVSMPREDRRARTLRRTFRDKAGAHESKSCSLAR